MTFFVILLYFILDCFVVKHLMATICSCTKQNAMKKIGSIFDGVIAIWFFLIMASTYFSISLSGMCSPEWIPTNVVLGSLAEIIFFVWLVLHIQKGASNLLRETKSFLVVKSLYKRVLFLSVIVVLYGFVTLKFSSLSFGHLNAISDIESKAALFYFVNVAGIATLVFVWMCIEIGRINKKMRF